MQNSAKSDSQILSRIVFPRITILAAVIAVFCLAQPAAASVLPGDILGIKLGMKKEKAEIRLREIAEFERDEVKRQQIWRLKSDVSFNYVFVGYDGENKVRYVTALLNEREAAKMRRVSFASLGDVAKAKKEVAPTSSRYIWEIKKGKKLDSLVVAMGRDENYVVSYSLKKVGKLFDEDEEEEREREGKDKDKDKDKDSDKH